MSVFNLPKSNDRLNIIIKVLHETPEHIPETWIKGYEIDGMKYPADYFGVPDGWEFAYNYLHKITTEEKEYDIEINLDKINKFTILFAKTPNAGTVKVISGEHPAESQEIVLTSVESGTVAADITVGLYPTILDLDHLALQMGISLLSALVVVYFSVIKKCFIPQQIVYTILLLYIRNIFYINNIYMLIIAMFAIATGWIATLYGKRNRNAFTLRNIAISFAASAYLAFSLVGEPLIFKASEISWSLENICYLAILTVLCYPITLTAASIFESICATGEMSSSKSDKMRLWRVLLVMGVSISVFLLYHFAFWPGNIPSDAIGVWEIAVGEADFIEGHPFYYVMIIRLLISIWNNPAWVVSFQYITFSATTTAYIIMFYHKGLKFRYCMALAVLIPLLPATGIGQVTMVKDYVHTTALLWTTYYILKYIWNDTSRIRISDAFGFSIALLLTALLRGNGFITLIVILVTVCAVLIKRRKSLPAIAYALIILAMYFALGAVAVASTPESGRQNTEMELPAWMIADTVSSVLVNGGTLSDKTMKYLTDIMPIEEWKARHSAYNLAPALAQTDPIYQFIQFTPFKVKVDILAEMIIRYPMNVLKVRMNKLNILWDISHVAGYQVFQHPTIAENTLGIMKKPNIISRFVWDRVLTNSKVMPIIDGVFYNNGIMLYLIFISLWKYSTMLGKKIIIPFIPLFGNAFSLIISINWQDYRYFYFIQPIALMLWIALAMMCSHRKREEAGKIDAA